MSRSFKWSLTLKHPNPNFVCISHLPHSRSCPTNLILLNLIILKYFIAKLPFLICSKWWKWFQQTKLLTHLPSVLDLKGINGFKVTVLSSYIFMWQIILLFIKQYVSPFTN
jgi:hypothetical protein